MGHTPILVALTSLFVFFFLNKQAPGLAVLIIWLCLIYVAIMVLYKLQLLPEIIMDLMDKLIDKDELKSKLEEMEREVKRVDPVEFADFVNSKVVGQKRVVNQVCKIISQRMARKRKNKPVFTLLISGPTGTGKTEMAKAITEFLYESPDAMCRIDVGNMDEHGVSSLVGSPKGYSGSDTWGRLTKHIRTTPESVILFDEIEKAGKNPNAKLYKILLSLLDEGRVTEQSVQVAVDATQSIVILTSNANQAELADLAERYKDEPEELVRASKDALQDYFAPEFLGRIDLVTTVNKLNSHDMAHICLIHLDKLAREYELELTNVNVDLLVEFIRKSKTLASYGIRELVREIEKMTSDGFIDAKDDGGLKVAVDFVGDVVSVDITEWREES